MIKVGLNTADTKEYLVIEVILHPAFNAATGANDFAVLRTGNAILMGLNVGVACLPTSVVEPVLFPGFIMNYINTEMQIEEGLTTACPASLPGICSTVDSPKGCTVSTSALIVGPTAINQVSLLFCFQILIGSGNHLIDGTGLPFLIGTSTGRNCTDDSTGANADIRPVLSWINQQHGEAVCSRPYEPQTH